MSNEELVIKIKAGIDTADNMLALWQQNKGVIHLMAKRYQGIAELEDLEQEGYLSLYAAVDGYNADSDYKFLTYAKQWIRQYMMRYVQNNSTTVRIPVHEREKLQEYRKIVNTYRIHHGRKPTRHEIARSMGASVKVITSLEKAARMEQIGSLDSYLLEDGSETVGDMVADDVDVEADVLEDVQQEQLKAVLWSSVDALPDQQRQVIRQRFQEGKTLKETGENLGVTLERARVVQGKALHSLYWCKALKVFLSDDDVYSMGITGNGVARFNSAWTSSTERAAFRRGGF